MKSNIANVRMPLGDIKNKTEEKENPIKKVNILISFLG
jgi:hypothetical protein